MDEQFQIGSLSGKMDNLTKRVDDFHADFNKYADRTEKRLDDLEQSRARYKGALAVIISVATGFFAWVGHKIDGLF